MKDALKVEKTSRSVIERKLLTALNDDTKVACLFTKQDLEDMIAALYGYEIGKRSGKVLTWLAHRERVKDLAKGMEQLLKEAFE